MKRWRKEKDGIQRYRWKEMPPGHSFEKLSGKKMYCRDGRIVIHIFTKTPNQRDEQCSTYL